MCLKAKENSRFKKSWRNITVYKAVEYDVNSDKYVSYYQNSLVEINTLLTVDYNRIKNQEKRNIRYGFHSFLSYKEALSFYKDETWGGSNVTLFKCVIPRNSYYIKGSFNEYKMVVSDKIIYKQKIDL